MLGGPAGGPAGAPSGPGAPGAPGAAASGADLKERGHPVTNVHYSAQDESKRTPL